MKKINAILGLLLLLTVTNCGSQDCGESCTRVPANSVDSSLNVNSSSQDGLYLENFTITATAGEIITVHVISYDVKAHLQLYRGDTLIQEGDTQANYTYPGPDYPNFWTDSLLVTADETDDYTVIVTTTEAGQTGDFTLDWTIGEEEQRECSAVDCGITI